MKKITTFFLLICIGHATLCTAQKAGIANDTLSQETKHWEQASRLKLIIDDMEHATIHQDSAIYRLLDRTVNGTEQQIAEIDGYRLQIYSSNQQQQAKQDALELEQSVKSIIDEPVYVQYATPFWKVRIGNFRTLADATAFKEEFLRRFPKLQSSTYVVRDKIEVKL